MQSPLRKGAQQPSITFRPVSIAAKRSPILETAALLYKRSPKTDIDSGILLAPQRLFCIKLHIEISNTVNF